MNAGRLFVSAPSAGNIGHFEFSIFNALVSPFAGPSSPSAFPLTLPVPPPVPVAPRAALLPRLVARVAREDMLAVFAEIPRRYFEKENTKIGFEMDPKRGGIQRELDALSQSRKLSCPIRHVEWPILTSADFLPLAPGSALTPRAGIHFADGRFLWGDGGDSGR